MEESYVDVRTRLLNMLNEAYEQLSSSSDEENNAFGVNVLNAIAHLSDEITPC